MIFSTVAHILVIKWNSEKYQNNTTFLISCLLVVDILFLLHAGIFAAIDLAHGGFATGLAGCIASYLCVFLLGYCSCFFLFCIAVDHYFVMVKLNPMPQWCKIFLAGGFIVGFLTLLGPIIAWDSIQDNLALDDTNTFCKPAGFGLPTDLVCGLVSVGGIVLITISGICYNRIAIFFRKYYKPDDENTPPERQKAFADALVLKRCIALTIGFVVTFTPVLVIFLLQQYFELQLPKAIVAVSNLLVASGVAIDPWLMIYFDPVFTKNLRILFPWLLSKRSSKKSTSKLTNNVFPAVRVLRIDNRSSRDKPTVKLTPTVEMGNQSSRDTPTFKMG
jgi:hypothetical protein